MHLPAKVLRSPNVAVFCRNWREYLEDACEIGFINWRVPITFRADMPWASAKVALDKNGPRRIYFTSIKDKEGLVRYAAILWKIVLYPEKKASETKLLLSNCLQSTQKEGLWGNTLYSIYGCRRLVSPFPYMALTKLSDSLPMDANFRHAYTVVYEYCPKCKKSPCSCPI